MWWWDGLSDVQIFFLTRTGLGGGRGGGEVGRQAIFLGMKLVCHLWSNLDCAGFFCLAPLHGVLSSSFRCAGIFFRYCIARLTLRWVSTHPSRFTLRNWRATGLKDVRAHCYCASLVRTHWSRGCHVIFKPAHQFENSTKYRADDLCINLVYEYFCWMLGDPHFFFGRSLRFLTLFIILKNKTNLCAGSFNYFSYTIKKRVELVHGYRRAWLISCIF